MSAFALEDGVVYHTYSAFARGVDALWGAYQWLDRAPKGRNEPDYWWHRHEQVCKQRLMRCDSFNLGRAMGGALGRAVEAGEIDEALLLQIVEVDIGAAAAIDSKAR